MRRYSFGLFMRTPFLLALVVLLPVPCFAGEHPPGNRAVTVAELEQYVADHQGDWDKRLAREIAAMKLTERLSDGEETTLEKRLPGKQSRLALLAIADESAFLDPPPSEMPNRPPPSSAEQADLIRKTVAYANQAMRRLPNFFATRTTVWFVGTPAVVLPALHKALFQANVRPPKSDDRLATTGTTRAAVFYRNGQEGYMNVADEKEECNHQIGSNAWGEFGEVLGRVSEAITHGTVTWSHWEQGADGPLATFAYQANLTYRFPSFCPDQTQIPPVQVHTHGEIAVDPADGAVLRLTEMWRFTVVAPGGLKPFSQEQDTAVEYAPQELGGRRYLCPQRSTSLTLYPYLPPVGGILGALYSSPEMDLKSRFGLPREPTVENINDILFTNYHLFQATVRILSNAGGPGPR